MEAVAGALVRQLWPQWLVLLRPWPWAENNEKCRCREASYYDKNVSSFAIPYLLSKSSSRFVLLQSTVSPSRSYPDPDFPWTPNNNFYKGCTTAWLNRAFGCPKLCGGRPTKPSRSNRWVARLLGWGNKITNRRSRTANRTLFAVAGCRFGEQTHGLTTHQE